MMGAAGPAELALNCAFWRKEERGGAGGGGGEGGYEEEQEEEQEQQQEQEQEQELDTVMNLKGEGIQGT